MYVNFDQKEAIRVIYDYENDHKVAPIYTQNSWNSGYTVAGFDSKYLTRHEANVIQDVIHDNVLSDVEKREKVLELYSFRLRHLSGIRYVGLFLILGSAYIHSSRDKIREKTIQRYVNLFEDNKLKIDGIIGKKTIQAINSLSQVQVDLIISLYESNASLIGSKVGSKPQFREAFSNRVVHIASKAVELNQNFGVA